jgi:hypothetical protein
MELAEITPKQLEQEEHRSQTNIMRPSPMIWGSIRTCSRGMRDPKIFGIGGSSAR